MLSYQKDRFYVLSVNMGLSRHCREDNRILETMVAIVATIKKKAKLLILKAKFKEIIA